MKPADFHWTESTIESVRTEGRSVVVQASGVFLLGAHGARRVRVEFRNAATAVQEITEYIGSPTKPEGFKQPVSVALLPPQASDGTELFGIEGFRAKPSAAWVDIEVHAVEAEVYEL